MDYQNLKSFLKEAGLSEEHSVTPIRAEASARKYFRIQLQKPGAGPESVILCAGLPVPYNDDDHFVKLAEFLRQRGIPVPRVLALDRQQGRMLLSDAGEEDLATLFARSVELEDARARKRCLRSAIDLMIALHRLDPPPVVAERVFDREKLSAEIEYLFSNLKDACAQLGVPMPISFELEMFVRELCALLGRDDHPRVFTHRDYHSRNILVRPGTEGRLSISIVDFQDARMGLPWYDLASLLYDPYAPITLADRREALEYYVKASGTTAPRFGLYYAQVLQRLLKALGTYIHQVTKKNHLVYLPSIPATLTRLEEAAQLGKFPDSIYIFAREMQRGFYPALVRAFPTATREADA